MSSSLIAGTYYDNVLKRFKRVVCKTIIEGSNPSVVFHSKIAMNIIYAQVVEFGRHASLRHWCLERTGSSPVLGTLSNKDRNISIIGVYLSR